MHSFFLYFLQDQTSISRLDWEQKLIHVSLRLQFEVKGRLLDSLHKRLRRTHLSLLVGGIQVHANV